MSNYQYIQARDLGDAWFQCLFRILEEGSVFKIDRGSFAGQKRLEFDYVVIEVEHPGTHPLVPQIETHFNIPNPVADDYLDEYVTYLMTGELKEGESYTYGQRLCRYPVPPAAHHNLHNVDIYIKEIQELSDLGIYLMIRNLNALV